ncbi:PD-(D/E)XK nuclease family protein [Hydrogenivirga sp. 128-5-R1-1]|uniref:PDDEXK-like family protein n=1 Tax=Hydrogenivirga sp. 128-5-R1-1 TaxID=392423 RepID=UPI00015F3697|nr:PD-(D/E)XK nuclease family protein [Hydrogenivirga sp. 128-5-R1-1]EDP76309.1 hypothetical protein HG1285_01843 [Hydrogenivirga sp. 128-5-R1-1]
MTEAEYKQKLGRFFGDLLFRYRIAKSVKAQMDRYLASDFNLVSLLAPGEETISRLIALLLEPDGVHGQGKVFLEKFVEILRKNLKKRGVENPMEDVGEFCNAKVETEHSTDKGGRVDIFIDLPNFVIGIENKIRARDQKDQLKNYNEYLKNKRESYLLIFLTCDGREPSEWSIPKGERAELEKSGKLITLSYGEFLKSWLKECLKECEADKVRWFIRDFISWIEENCKEVSDDGQKEDN